MLNLVVIVWESECFCCVFNGSINLYVLFIGKVIKIFEEYDWVGIEEEILIVIVKIILCDYGILIRELLDIGFI